MKSFFLVSQINPFFTMKKFLLFFTVAAFSFITTRSFAQIDPPPFGVLIPGTFNLQGSAPVSVSAPIVITDAQVNVNYTFSIWFRNPVLNPSVYLSNFSSLVSNPFFQLVSVPDPSTPIAPGDSAEIKIGFATSDFGVQEVGFLMRQKDHPTFGNSYSPLLRIQVMVPSPNQLTLDSNAVSPGETLNFGSVYTDSFTTFPFQFRNNSTEPLVISAASMSDPAFTILEAIDNVQVPGLSSFQLTVKVYPTFSGQIKSNLRISTDQGNFPFVLKGISQPAPLATKGLVNASVSVSPNPTQNRVQVTGLTEGSAFSVVDLQGKVMLSGVNNSAHEIDFSPLKSGVYLLVATGAKPVRILKN